MELKAEHAMKAEMPMLVRLSCKVTETSEEQSMNVPSSMHVMLLGIVNDAREEQLAKA